MYTRIYIYTSEQKIMFPTQTVELITEIINVD